MYEIFKSRQVDRTLTSLKRKAVPVHLLLEERWIAWNLEASFLLNNRYTRKFVLRKQDFCHVTAFLHRLTGLSIFSRLVSAQFRVTHYDRKLIDSF